MHFRERQEFGQDLSRWEGQHDKEVSSNKYQRQERRHRFDAFQTICFGSSRTGCGGWGTDPQALDLWGRRFPGDFFLKRDASICTLENWATGTKIPYNGGGREWLRGSCILPHLFNCSHVPMSCCEPGIAEPGTHGEHTRHHAGKMNLSWVVCEAVFLTWQNTHTLTESTR